MKFCPICGSQLPDEAAFCGSCGAGLQTEAQTPPAYQQAPAYGPAGGQGQPVRRRHRTGMLAAALLCVVGAVAAVVKPDLIAYSLPAAIALAILAVMFLVLAWSPREARGLLGKAAGLSQGAFAGLCVALAIVVPVVGEVGGILPQEYKLMGTWRMIGENELLLLELERDSFAISSDGETTISGSWSYQDDMLTLTPGLFTGEEPITGRAQLMGNMMTFSILGDETVVFSRYS